MRILWKIFLVILIFSFAKEVFSATQDVSTSVESSNANQSASTEVVIDKIIITLDDTKETIADKFLALGLIENKENFVSALEKNKLNIVPGAYKINKNMTEKDILKVLTKKPYMKWIVIPEGLRKEEIALILSTGLGWTKTQKSKWISVYTRMKAGYTEGVYFPDTYLIPVSESPLNVANRLITKFNEKFSPYLMQFNAKNMKWTTGLTFASIVQREAANDEDMPLIAGILWNRLNKGMTLDVDATLQYARGDKGKGWWAMISVSDKKINSLFNTYTHKGLPPAPISNPGLSAIEAVLNPTATDCLYYLHDKEKNIHCAVTYEEHKINIDKYLKSN